MNILQKRIILGADFLVLFRNHFWVHGCMNHRELKSEVPKVGSDSGPLSGSPNCASFEQSVNYFLALRSYQVRCFLQWAKVIRARAAKEPLFINFDETAMKFNYAK